MFVTGFGLAVELLASAQILLEIDVPIVAIRGLVHSDVHPTRGSCIKDFAILASVAFSTAACIVARPVNALTVVLAAVVHALVSVVRLTVGPHRADHTLAPEIM